MDGKTDVITGFKSRLGEHETLMSIWEEGTESNILVFTSVPLRNIRKLSAKKIGERAIE